MHIGIVIVGLSATLQAIAGILAFRLIRITRHRLPWSLVSLGLCGMALRRVMSLAEALGQGASPVAPFLPFELLGLLTSGVMLWGVARIRPVFDEAQAARIAAESTAQKLQTALDNIKVLQGILPTCAWCKKIRDEAGQWHEIEAYVQNRTDAEFSHGICPECMKRYYPQQG